MNSADRAAGVQRAGEHGQNLVRNGWVIAMDPEIGDVRGVDVLIEDGLIAAVGHGLPSAGAEVIEVRDRLVLPGLIDAHIHLWQPGDPLTRPRIPISAP